MATLQDPTAGPRKLLGAMQALDADPTDEAYLKTLNDMMWRPGYTLQSREEAFQRLLDHDEAGLKRTIRNELPRMSARAWQERLCELIVEYDWIELSPGLVSSWARRIGFVDDLDRVEYKALVQLYGEGNVVDAVFALLVESSNNRFLRVRCWELLERLGQRDRLVMLLQEGPIEPDDLMLLDLRAAAVELGIVPRTREEILWVRKLREPQRAAFWSRASAVVTQLPESRRRELELRDLPIVVAASVHDPWLLNAEREALYERVASYLSAATLHVEARRFEGFPGTYGQRLYEHRGNLTWGDLAAMLLAIEATQVPQVVAHIFDYAERDREDKTCEYGGVIELDDQGRFEVLEFPPKFRRHDNEFIASQKMLDAAYTAVFHFHNHAQRYSNGRHTAPGLGDVRYADAMRANCLVFTFVDKRTLNVDYYRYGNVIVDLGEIRSNPP